MSWGRLSRLIARLPRESWTAQAAGGEAARWGDSEHLLASIIDTLVFNGWMYARGTFKRTPDTPPLPLRRPGQPEPGYRLGGKKSYTPREIDQLLSRARVKGGE